MSRLHAWWAAVLGVVMLSASVASAADGLTGQVVTPTGAPLADVTVSSGAVSTVTDENGRFLLAGVGPGEVTVERLAYAPRTVTWDGTSDWLTIPMNPRVLRGLHVAGWVAADPSGFGRMLDLVDDTAVNALVIDVKNENGRVYHRSSNATVGAVGAQASDTFELEDLVALAHAHDAYVITRIVSFQDPIVAVERPGWAVIDVTTGKPFDKGGQKFLDPTDPDARAYALELAAEVCAAGVDEVQFDYVRFPDGNLANARFDGPADASGRQHAITTFLAEARALLAPMGCATAADIFGWITNTVTDGGIGQQLEAITDTIDVVSPMIYPSHYSSGWYGFAVPNDHPAEVVTRASRDALARMTESAAVLRPWIQDFWYTSSQVRAQIDALDGLGLGWMSWNILSEFTAAAYPGDGVLTAGDSVPDVTSLTLGESGFWDVGDDHTFASDVSWMGRSGISSGCNPPYDDFFCPDRHVTRGEMAAFLVRALGLEPGEDPGFADVEGSVFVADIAALSAASITRGCNPDGEPRFCPKDPVTRGQMAAFLVRALDLPPGPDPGFTDLTTTVFASDVAALSAASITRGCDPPENVRFCPDRPVTRAEMAAFLHRALGSD